MDKKTQRQIRRAARKSANELKTCSNTEFDEFMEYLAQKELEMGKMEQQLCNLLPEHS